MQPEVYVEMSLIFDNNYDVYQISNVIGIQPTMAKRKSETKVNMLTRDNNPGFWSLKSEVFREYDLKFATENLVNQIKDKVQLINELCNIYQGEVIFDVVASFYANEEPAIYFEREFIELVHCLNAEIQLDLYTLVDG